MSTLELSSLMSWLGGMLWALGRIGGLFLLAPVFSATTITREVRVAMVVLFTIVLAPLAPTQLDLFSATGVATMVTQVVIGAGIGFVLRLVFEAVALGGNLIGQSMGLGFAELINPTAGGSVPVLGQFYQMLVTLLFVTMDGHLHMIALLADSFRTLPPGLDGITTNGLFAVVAAGSELFAGAVRVALPAMTALLLVNIGFAAISRAAPSMNLFAVGFPISICMGFIALWLCLRGLASAFSVLQAQAWSLVRQLIGA